MKWGQAPVVTTLPGSSTAQYKAANGAYDENNNLLFYVVDGTIYNAAGNVLTSSPSGGVFLKEIGIAPVPGQCKKYYVIMGIPQAPLTGVNLFNAVVDCSSGSAVVSSTWNSFATLGGATCGIAISKVISGTGEGAIRYLYVISHQSFRRYTIGSSGIGSMTILPNASLATFSSSQTRTSEAELDFTGTKFAWAGENAFDGKVYEILTSSPYTLTQYTLPNGNQNISGLEYDGSDNLWVSANSTSPQNNGIYKITAGSSSPPVLISNSSAYNNTQLELSTYGLIHAVNNNGTFGYIDPTANTISPTTLNIPITLYSNAHSQLNSTLYSLPDQIDNENYEYFSGVPNVVANFQINGENRSTTCNTIQTVLNCNAINFLNQSTGANQFSIKLEPIDINCNILTGQTSYTSALLSSVPADLRNLPGTNGTLLSTNPNRYKVTLTSTNGCYTNQVFAYIMVLSNPATSSFSTTINNAVNGIPCYSTNQNAPCLVCIGGITMNLSSSTLITSYTRKTDMKFYINGNPFWYTAHGPQLEIVQNPQNTLTGVYVTQAGFSFLSGADYRVTVTLNNDCGSQSLVNYFKGASCKTGDLESESENTAYSISNPTISNAIFPNPSNGKSTVQFNLQSPSNVDIYITNLEGKRVKEIVTNMYFEGGNYEYALDFSHLSSGVYMYHYVTSQEHQVSKLVKN